MVNSYVDNAGILDLESLLAVDDITLVSENLAGHRSDDRFSYLSAVQSVGDSELLVVLVTSESGQIISLCVEELVVEVVLRGLNAGHVAGVQLSVDLEKSLFLVLGAVLLDGSKDPGILAELSGQLSVGGKTQRTQERGNGDLSVLIYADIVYVVGVHLVFEPCAAVRDNGSLVEGLTGLVVLEAVVNARGTNQLRYYNTLRAIDDEGTAVGHKRQIAHIDLVVHELTGLLVEKTRGHTDRNSIGSVTLLALLNGILSLVVKAVADEREFVSAIGIGDRGELLEDLLDTVIQEPFVGILLNTDEVRHIDDLIDLRKTHSGGFSELYGLNIHHRLYHSLIKIRSG